MSGAARFTLVLGGARSGKSDLACRLAAASGSPVTFLATGRAGDVEMAQRIERHRRGRPATWDTVEEPLAVAEAVASIEPARTLVLDCVTLWVASLLWSGLDDATCAAEAERLARALADRPGRSLVVANEVGWGIVPADPDTRRYRDVHGRTNRILADRADEVVLVVAGRVLPLATATAHWGLDA